METVYFTRTTGGLTAQSYFYGSEGDGANLLI